MGGKRMPVGNEKEALVLVLQFHPVFQHTMIMSQVQTSGRTHTRKYPGVLRSNCFHIMCFG